MKRPLTALAGLLLAFAVAGCAPAAGDPTRPLPDPAGATLNLSPNADGYQVVQFRSGAAEVRGLTITLYGSGLSVNSTACSAFEGAIRCYWSRLPARHSLLLPARGVVSVDAQYDRDDGGYLLQLRTR